MVATNLSGSRSTTAAHKVLSNVLWFRLARFRLQTGHQAPSVPSPELRFVSGILQHGNKRTCIMKQFDRQTGCQPKLVPSRHLGTPFSIACGLPPVKLGCRTDNFPHGSGFAISGIIWEIATQRDV